MQPDRSIRWQRVRNHCVCLNAVLRTCTGILFCGNKACLPCQLPGMFPLAWVAKADSRNDGNQLQRMPGSHLGCAIQALMPVPRPSHILTSRALLGSTTPAMQFLEDNSRVSTVYTPEAQYRVNVSLYNQSHRSTTITTISKPHVLVGAAAADPKERDACAASLQDTKLVRPSVPASTIWGLYMTCTYVPACSCPTPRSRVNLHA